MTSSRERPRDVLDGPGTAARRREFAVLLGEFRRTPVLVSLGEGPGLIAEGLTEALGELKELGMVGAAGAGPAASATSPRPGWSWATRD
ncbi:hypothetical protein [Streptomyces mirabilis]|uniref:hypothetical protein n=1 Tax=Streptomyces mirabilis TaxID=68239 RepID=UPI00332C369F